MAQPAGTSAINVNNRFAPLDGLRAVAALGVLWIHTWTLHGNPRCVIAGLDIASVLALAGNGVDLFFVISGFCMYYFYAKNKSFSYADFWTFIKKRWIRLSPAFYTACLAYIIAAKFRDPAYPVLPSIFTGLAYLNGILSNYTPVSILWSLTTEWQFYIIIPFLLIYQNKLGFKNIFLIIAFLMLIMAVISVIWLKSGSDNVTSQIIFRYFEFMWGILAGNILLTRADLQLKYRIAYFIGFVLITYSGRALLSKPILNLDKDHYNLFKLAGFTIMGLGFSGIIYMAITSKQILKAVLGNPVLSFIGKISFSFYLWHALIYPLVGAKMMAFFPALHNLAAPVITFFISAILLMPIATASFYLLERPFLNRTAKK